MKARAVASLSLPTCATTLGQSGLTEVVTASTRGSSDNQQLLVWLLQGNFYITQSYRASDAHLVAAGSPTRGQRDLPPPLTPTGAPVSSGPPELGRRVFCSHNSLVPALLF